MRWFLGLVLVVALITGALYGVGRFLLPNALEVTRTATIERPRASVFAAINDLNIAVEWSPYTARDPDAEYNISETPGSGQTMRWASNVREVGSGRMSIVNSIQNQVVESIIEIGERATLNSRIDLEPVEDATAVSWSVAAECAEGAINVPCRYMNLIMRSTIESTLDNGLARLKHNVEMLPNADFEHLEIVETPVAPIKLILVSASIAGEGPTMADRQRAELEAFNALNLFVASTGGQVTNTGEFVRVFPANNGVGGRYSFSVGYPHDGPTPSPLVGVEEGTTPGGAALRVIVVGRRSSVPMVYEPVRAFMQAHRISLRPGAPSAWEVVTPAPQPAGADPTDPVERTEVYFPID